MPFYDYKCTNCNESWENLISMENRHKPEEEPCPYCQKTGKVELAILGIANIVSGVGGHGSLLKKAGDGWKDVLNKIKKGSRKDNTIRT